MPKEAYDDENIPLVAEVGGGVAAMKVKNVSFVVTLDKQGTQDVKPAKSVPVKDGFPRSATYDFKEAVPDDKDFYDLTFVASIVAPSGASIKHEGGEKIRVWPGEVEIKFTSDDAEHKKKVKFRFVAGGQSKNATAEDNGVFKGRGPRAPYTLEVMAPWQIVTTTKGTGRKREYKVQKVSDTARIVKPTTGTGKDLFEIINCAPDTHDYKTGTKVWSDERPYGNVIEILVEAKNKKAQVDDLVYIECTFGRQSKRTTPEPELLADGGVESIVKSNSNKTQKGRIKLDAELRAKFKVNLGKAGGDTCEIKVGMTPACDDGPESKVKIENWRLIWYQLGRPAKFSPEMKNAVKALQKVFVDYRQSDLNSMDAPTTADYTTWYPANKLIAGGSGNFLVVGSHNVDDIGNTFANALRPRESRIIFCDMQFDGVVAPNVRIRTVPAGTAGPIDAAVLNGIAPDDEPALLPNAVTDGTFAVTAEYRQHTPPGPWTPIPEGDIEIDYVNRKNIARITLSGAAATLNATQAIQIRTKAKWAQGPYLGWAVTGSPTVVIALREPNERAAAEWNKTIVHEVGHMMRLVMDVTAPGLTLAGDHQRFYSGRGGSGTHCADGVSQTDFDAPGDIDPDMGPTCVMYAIGIEECKVDFCTRCAPFVLAEDLTTLA